jgi:salicylate hydroxylase
VSRLTVAVVGAGIAGLAASLALARRGHAITLLERRTGFGESGAGIQLSPNASRILVGLGLGPALARSGCEPDGVVIRSLAAGREIGRVAQGRHMRERYGAPYLSIARQDLHTILLDAVRASPGVRLRVGRGLADIVQEGGSMQVRLESAAGPDLVAADLVVGADGIWSRARACLGDERQPTAAGHVAYRAVVPCPAEPDGEFARSTGLWLGRGRHVVHYPIAGGRLLNIVAVERRPDALDGWSAPRSRADVRALWANAAPPLRALLDGAETWSAWSLADLAAQNLGSGRVALVGDAAHPVLPYLAQGGALAIEDAAVLASALEGAGADVASAVSAYGAARLPRVRRVQDAARRNARVFHARGPVALARNWRMASLGAEGMADRYAWLYGWNPEPGA